MVEVLAVAEAVLYVDDLPETTAFYREVLQLPLTRSFAEASFLQVGARSTLILFDRRQLRERESQIPAHGAEGPGHVALAIPHEELTAWRKRLQVHGVEIEHEQAWPQGTHSLYFRDPAGNSVELIDARHYPAVWARIKGADA